MSLIDQVVAALEELKGLEINVIDVQSLTTITDHMIICTGTSSRHVKALAENVVKMVKAGQHLPLGVEGQEQGEWILIDLGSMIVHVMLQKARDFYGLEKLWQLPAEYRHQREQKLL